MTIMEEIMNKLTSAVVIGSAALTLAADSALAQARSTQQIPVRKESPGEVAPPRVDTVTVYRTDTLRMTRVDTVMDTRTVVRVDTVMQAAPLPVIPEIGGFYLGLATGASMPAANFNDSDHTGWRVELPFGIDPVGSRLGLRFNVGYSKYEPHSGLKTLLDDAQLFNADADLKVRLFGVSPRSARIQLYGIGGGSYNRFKDILEHNASGFQVGDSNGGATVPTTPDHSWHDGWGYNVGGGAEIGKGATNLFIESRFASFSGKITDIRHVPLVIGVTWY
jgi:hypothetical protein